MTTLTPSTTTFPSRLDLAASGDSWEQVLARLRAQEADLQALRMSDAMATIESMWASQSDCQWLEAPTLKVSQQVLLHA